MSYTAMALVMALVLVAAAAAIQQSRVEVFYVWPAEVDRGLCDAMTANVAACYSRVGDSAAALEFLRRNLEVALERNPLFRVLGYEVINMTAASGADCACVNVTVAYDLPWGRHVSRCWLLVVILSRAKVVDPLTGEEYVNLTVACATELGAPVNLRALGGARLAYSCNSTWVLVAPSSAGSAILEDWRGVRVKLALRGG